MEIKDEALSEEELDKVSGGANITKEYFKCKNPDCGKDSYLKETTKSFVCSYCGFFNEVNR